MMYHTATLLIIAFTFLPSLRILAQTMTTLTYDPVYDNAYLSLDHVACSNGANGLQTKNYTTLGSLPSFPFLGGVYTVSSWNSSACGTCYAVTYKNVMLNVLAVDVSRVGFTVSEAAMNLLTGYRAVELGRVNVSSVLVSPSACGMPTLR